ICQAVVCGQCPRSGTIIVNCLRTVYLPFRVREASMPSTVKKRDRVHELTDVPFPARVAPDPLIVSDENTLAVAYVTTAPSAAIVVFRQCFAYHFGLPNDEA